MRAARGVAVGLAAAAAGYGAWEVARVRDLIRRSRTLDAVATGRHELGVGPELLLWVMGDSAALGHGAGCFATSLVGRVAAGLSAGRRVIVENVAVSGAKTAQVLAQPLPPRRAGLVLVTAGSNDLARLASPAAVGDATARVLGRVAPLAERVVVTGPGVIADAGLAPHAVRPLYRWLRPRYLAAMAAAAAAVPNAVHVDPAEGVEALARAEYLAAVSEVDRFHLNDAGHRWWADRVLAALAAP